MVNCVLEVTRSGLSYTSNPIATNNTLFLWSELASNNKTHITFLDMLGSTSNAITCSEWEINGCRNERRLHSLISRNTYVVLIEAAGSSKNHTLAIIMNEPPPSLSCSTPLPMRPVQILVLETPGGNAEFPETHIREMFRDSSGNAQSIVQNFMTFTGNCAIASCTRNF